MYDCIQYTYYVLYVLYYIIVHRFFYIIEMYITLKHIRKEKDVSK